MGGQGNLLGWVTFELRSSNPESMWEEYSKQKECLGHKMEMSLACLRNLKKAVYWGASVKNDGEHGRRRGQRGAPNFPAI